MDRSLIAVIAAVVGLSAITQTQAQSPTASAPGGELKTPPLQTAPLQTAPLQTAPLQTAWGEPDLQGIWMEETDTPLQRPARFASQEFFTAAQRAELDVERAAMAGKDQRAERGTERDVGGSYNQLFVPRKHTGARTSGLAGEPACGRTLDAHQPD